MKSFQIWMKVPADEVRSIGKFSEHLHKLGDASRIAMDISGDDVAVLWEIHRPCAALKLQAEFEQAEFYETDEDSNEGIIFSKCISDFANKLKDFVDEIFKGVTPGKTLEAGETFNPLKLTGVARLDSPETIETIVDEVQQALILTECESTTVPSVEVAPIEQLASNAERLYEAEVQERYESWILRLVKRTLATFYQGAILLIRTVRDLLRLLWAEMKEATAGWFGQDPISEREDLVIMV